MRAWWLVALAMSGEAAADRVDRIALRRPDTELPSLLPDPMVHLRWPLGLTHPALEPRFPIAHALADNGVTWTELCRRGAQHRHVAGDADLQRYLHAWCEVANDKLVAAFEELAIMEKPVVADLAPAIHADLANLLAQSGDAEHAEHLLSSAHLESVDMFDQLAATYVEIGDAADANQINEEAIARQTRAPDASKCQRLTRRLLLAPEEERPRLLEAVAPLTDPRRGGVAPTCRALYDELSCWIAPQSNCRGYLQGRFRSESERNAQLSAFAMYFGWSNVAMPFTLWLYRASWLHGRQVVGAGDLEAVALAGAFLTAPCTDKLELIGRMADERRKSDKLAPKYDALLKRIATAANDLWKMEPSHRGQACSLVDRDAVVDLPSLK